MVSKCYFHNYSNEVQQSVNAKLLQLTPSKLAVVIIVVLKDSLSKLETMLPREVFLLLPSLRLMKRNSRPFPLTKPEPWMKIAPIKGL
jgi:hypothetical protein